MEREDVQLYRELSIDSTKVDVLTLTQKDISSSYRKAALRWHPDKNPNDPSAAARFSKVFLAYETLSDPTRRKEYDDHIRVIRRRRKVFQQQDETRRRMRLQLHQREQEAAQPTPPTSAPRPREARSMDDQALTRIQREIERLRKMAQEERDDDARPSSSKPQTNTHALQAGAWARVPGYGAFSSKSTNISFTDLEQTVLKGRSPF